MFTKRPSVTTARAVTSAMNVSEGTTVIFVTKMMNELKISFKFSFVPM